MDQLQKVILASLQIHKIYKWIQKSVQQNKEMNIYVCVDVPTPIANVKTQN